MMSTDFYLLTCGFCGKKFSAQKKRKYCCKMCMLDGKERDRVAKKK